MKSLHAFIFIASLVPVVGCVHSPKITQTYIVESSAITGHPQIEWGGFSGLQILEANDKHFRLLTLTDRGPNGKAKEGLRPFLYPDFNPSLVYLLVDREGGRASIEKIVPLHDFRGKKMTGLPQVARGTAGKGETETGIDEQGRKLSPDPEGIDPEAICMARDGSFWIGEEYGPDLMHFSSEGRLLERYRPGKGLPDWLMKRRSNGGFEGVACIDDLIFAILQVPLPGETRMKMIRFDSRQKKVTAVYEYSPEFSKVGDLFALSQDRLLLIDQNGKTGIEGRRAIYEIDLKEAQEGVVKKKKVMDLSKFDVEKAEGLAVWKNLLLVISDNDFGVSGGEKSPLGVFQYP